MSYGVMELDCPKCGITHIIGKFGMLGEPCFDEEALIGFRCSCGANLIVKYDVKLVEYEPDEDEEDK